MQVVGKLVKESEMSERKSLDKDEAGRGNGL